MLANYRKAASASNAAVLVALIAILIVIYILALPPDVRCSILDNCALQTSTGITGEASPTETVIFSAVPKINAQESPLIKTMPSFSLRTLTQGGIIASRSGLTVDRSVFHNNADKITFYLPKDSSDVLLSFSVQQAIGNLRISLNGEAIFDSAISSLQPDPVNLPQSLLIEDGDNELSFSVSGVGFAFWSTNKYVLSNILVTADVTSFDEASVTQRFVLPSLTDFSSVQLSFVPDCISKPSRIMVSVNNNLVFSGIPQCNVPITQDIPMNILSRGENTLFWKIDSGEFIIDQVEIIAQPSIDDSSLSFFLSPELLSSVAASGQDILLRLSFASQGSEGKILLNGNDLFFRTHKSSFAGPISSYIRAGDNELVITESSSPVTLLEVLYD